MFAHNSANIGSKLECRTVFFQYRIVGVQMKSPAYHALKEGQLRFLDVITQLNEDDIQSKEWLEHTTKSKTRPMLTIQRNNSTPSGIKNLLNKGSTHF